jgi:acyl carrier protein
VVVAAEVQAREGEPLDTQGVATAIRRAVAEKHDVHVHTVLLLEPRTILKTSSGKIQRRACKAGFLAGGLEVVATHEPSRGEGAQESGTRPAGADGATKTKEAIIAWLSSYLTRQLRVPPEDLDIRRSLTDYGMDSAMVLDLSGDLGQWLDRKLQVDVFYKHPTIESLAVHLTEPPLR